jgi:hypothetical protein
MMDKRIRLKMICREKMEQTCWTCLKTVEIYVDQWYFPYECPECREKGRRR